MEKVFIECKSKEHGERIIKYFIDNGVNNILRFDGDAVNSCYYIDSQNNIRCDIREFVINRGYKEIFIPPFEKPYPKWMYVSCASFKNANINKRNNFLKVLVFAEHTFSDGEIRYLSENIDRGSHEIYSWKYAVDVDADEEIPTIELTIDQIAEKFNVDPSQIKIKK